MKYEILKYGMTLYVESLYYKVVAKPSHLLNHMNPKCEDTAYNVLYCVRIQVSDIHCLTDNFRNLYVTYVHPTNRTHWFQKHIYII